MNRYKRYTSKQYKNGYEKHQNKINTNNAPYLTIDDKQN